MLVSVLTMCSYNSSGVDQTCPIPSSLSHRARRTPPTRGSFIKKQYASVLRSQVFFMVDSLEDYASALEHRQIVDVSVFHDFPLDRDLTG